MGRSLNILLLAQLFVGLVYSYAVLPVQPQPQPQPQRDISYATVPTTTEATDYYYYYYEQTDYCTPNPCLNMGSCISSTDPQNPGFQCLCLDNYQGDYCETVITTTTTPAPMILRRLPVKKVKTPVPIRQPMRDVVPTNTGYAQQIPLRDIDTTTTTTTTTPAPYVPYGQPQIPMRDIVSIKKPMRFLDLLPTTTTTTPAPYQPQRPVQTFGGYAVPQMPMRTQFDITPTGCSGTPCKNEGTCNDMGNGQFFCTCPWGWSGPTCEICITECASNPCPANRVCQAKFGGGFDCVCPPKTMGMNCEIQLDVCSTNPCINGGICTPSQTTGYTCTCKQPFAGVNCEQTWSNPCTEEVLRSPYMLQFEWPWARSSYLICADVDQWVQMPCATGTFFNKAIGHCVPDDYTQPQCPVGFCLNDGECVLNTQGQLACKCKPGYTGANCEIDIDECQLNRNACGGGLCVDQINTYYCICPTGVGLDCVNTIPDPCTSDNINPDTAYFTIISPNNDHFLHCTSLGSWQVRKCADGLFWNQEEKTCTMDRPKLKTGACVTMPCKNGECIDNGFGSFRCLCKEGFTGQFCEITIDYCASNPCSNGGRCLAYPGGYTCVCPDKIIDDCCCTGVVNPCPDRSKLVPGLNNYFPHLFPNRYIHCDFDGRAFVRTCATGTRWAQSVLSCLSEEQMNITFAAVTTTTPRPVLRDFAPVMPSYAQQQPQQVFYQQTYTQPTTTTTTTTPRPVLRDFVMPSYAQQQPQQVFYQQTYTQPTTTTTTTTTPRPVLRDFVMPSYAQQQTFYQQTYTQPTTTTTTPLPVLRDFVMPSYSSDPTLQTTSGRILSNQGRSQGVVQVQKKPTVPVVQTVQPMQPMQPMQPVPQGRFIGQPQPQQFGNF